MDKNPKSQKLLFLDVLRGFAALYVTIGHATLLWGANKDTFPVAGYNTTETIFKHFASHIQLFAPGGNVLFCAVRFCNPFKVFTKIINR